LYDVLLSSCHEGVVSVEGPRGACMCVLPTIRHTSYKPQVRVSPRHTEGLFIGAALGCVQWRT